MDWIKFGLLFGITTILPVWIFNFVDISLKMKLIFTLGGAVGCYLAITRGSLKGFSGRKRNQ